MHRRAQSSDRLLGEGLTFKEWDQGVQTSEVRAPIAWGTKMGPCTTGKGIGPPEKRDLKDFAATSKSSPWEWAVIAWLLALLAMVAEPHPSQTQNAGPLGCCRVGFGQCRKPLFCLLLSRLPLTQLSILVCFLFQACMGVSALHISCSFSFLSVSSTQLCSRGHSLYMSLKLSLKASKRQIVI